MADYGKRFIVRSLVRQVEQYLRFGYAQHTDQLKLVLWNDAAVVTDWQPDDEVPGELLASRGSGNFAALTQLLATYVGAADRLIFFTDGYGIEQPLSCHIAAPSNETRIIKIGPDANPRLAGSNVFEAENLMAALDGWA